MNLLLTIYSLSLIDCRKEPRSPQKKDSMASSLCCEGSRRGTRHPCKFLSEENSSNPPGRGPEGQSGVEAPVMWEHSKPKGSPQETVSQEGTPLQAKCQNPKMSRLWLLPAYFSSKRRGYNRSVIPCRSHSISQTLGL
jgi:hypothetical protein